MDILLEKMLENKSPSEISTVLINLNKFQLNSKKHIKKYNKLRKLHSEIIDSMENYIIDGKYNINDHYNSIYNDIDKEIPELDFEDNQTEFQELKEEFYSDIVFGDKSPDEEVFKEWYEEIEPESAAEIYRQVASAYEADQRVKDTAMAYEAMKPEQAAAILQSMTSMTEVCDILSNMTDEARGEVLGAMDEDYAAKVTSKLLP